MSFSQEFKTFVVKGNVMDLAVGVIIGGAFGKIVDSAVSDLIMPLVSKLFGGLDFSNYYVALAGQTAGLSLLEAKKLGIPLVGVVDTNHSPVGIDYVIPGNDDSAKAVALYARGIADAILEGRANAVNDVVKAVAAGSDEFVEVKEEASA